MARYDTDRLGNLHFAADRRRRPGQNHGPDQPSQPVQAAPSFGHDDFLALQRAGQNGIQVALWRSVPITPNTCPDRSSTAPARPAAWPEAPNHAGDIVAPRLAPLDLTGPNCRQAMRFKTASAARRSEAHCSQSGQQDPECGRTQPPHYPGKVPSRALGGSLTARHATKQLPAAAHQISATGLATVGQACRCRISTCRRPDAGHRRATGRSWLRSPAALRQSTPADEYAAANRLTHLVRPASRTPARGSKHRRP